MGLGSRVQGFGVLGLMLGSLIGRTPVGNAVVLRRSVLFGGR